MEQYFPKLTEPALRWVRFTLLVGGLALLSWLFYQLRTVFTPILIALAIAYILNPVVVFFERGGVRRLLTVIAVYVFTATMAITGLVVLGTRTIVQINDLQNRLPEYFEQLSRQLETLQRRVDPSLLLGLTGFERFGIAQTQPALTPHTQPTTAAVGPDMLQPGAVFSDAGEPPDAPAAVDETAAAAPESDAGAPAAPRPDPAAPRLWAALQPWLVQYLSEWANTGWTRASSFLGGVVNVVMLVALIPMYTFFFLWRFDHLVRTIHDHLPAMSRPTIVRIVSTIDQSIANFFRGRLTTCLLVGTLNGVGWTIVGVKYSLVLGILAAIFNLVPYMGTLVLPPALIFAYMQAGEMGVNWFWPVVLTFGVYMMVQFLESFIFSPIFEGTSVGLHPITTVVALLIGAQVAGPLGMLLSIPVASTLKILAAEWLLPEIRRLAEPPPPADSGA